jgi:hypothetical protein
MSGYGPDDYFRERLRRHSIKRFERIVRAFVLMALSMALVVIVVYLFGWGTPR